MRWRPGRALLKVAQRFQRRLASEIRGSRPPVKGGTPGGSLSRQVVERRFLRLKPWGVILLWFKVDSRLSWYRQGTIFQRPRPLTMVPDREEVRREVLADAHRHFTAREKRGR